MDGNGEMRMLQEEAVLVQWMQTAMRQLGLGEINADAVCPLSGGCTHRMFRVEVGGRTYAVKLLKPQIMARPEAMGNYRRAEAMEAQIVSAGLPVLGALVIGGQRMQCVQGQYLYVYEYWQGETLPDHRITPEDCRRIGGVLAQLHQLCSREDVAPLPMPELDWPAMLRTVQRCGGEMQRVADALEMNLPLLIRLTEEARQARKAMTAHRVICHQDMDPKNVLFGAEGDLRVIDLECLDWGVAGMELMDMAMAWAGERRDEERMKAMLQGYRAAGGELPEDPARLLASRVNWLEWLADCTRRCTSADAHERDVGCTQAIATMEALRRDQLAAAALVRLVEQMR